jgi:PIN domain nuclease of toxin-antitoxin system
MSFSTTAAARWRARTTVARFVLDASAVLALLNDEPGRDDVVEALKGDAVLSTVNAAEVVGKLMERGKSRDEASLLLQLIAVEIADFTLALAERTGELRVETRSRGLSLGDHACLALAEREGGPALTCDRNWAGAVAGIEIRCIR